jgi:tRNA-Thr(GGU) m(6)t(6)A37 methyltransferase TsaA
MEIIAHIRTDFKEKFGIPRQSGVVQALQGRIVFTPPYRKAEALRGLEEYSHLWIVWQFSRAIRTPGEWHSTVRPPRLGGNKRVGVFATRSPFRPNPIGLSCVKIEGIDPDTPQGPVIRVSGVDMLDGTPIYDIKPYLSYCDAHPEAECGFADRVKYERMAVTDPEEALNTLPEALRTAAREVLEQDPRPHYQEDAERVYGLNLGGYEIRFRTCGQEITVVEVKKEQR